MKTKTSYSINDGYAETTNQRDALSIARKLRDSDTSRPVSIHRDMTLWREWSRNPDTRQWYRSY